jgi:hypothetical protein
MFRRSYPKSLVFFGLGDSSSWPIGTGTPRCLTVVTRIAIAHTRVLTNSGFSPRHFGYARAQDMRELVKRGLATSLDVDAFLAEQLTLNASGRYFYCITGFAYVGRVQTHRG